MPVPERAAPWLVALVPPLLWGAAFPAIKVVLPAFSAAELAAVRILAGVALLALVALALRLPRIARRDVPLFLAVGFLGFPAYQILTNLGLERAPAGAGSLLVPLVPMLAAFCAWWWFGEPLARRAWLGVAAAALGVVVIVRGQGGSLDLGAGFVYLLLATGAAGVYFALEKRLLRDYPARAVLTYTMGIGSLFVLPLAPSAARSLVEAAPATLAAVGFLAIFPTVVAFGVMAWGLRRSPTASATSSIFLIPVFAFALAWPLLGEIPRATDVLGGALAVGGVAWVQRALGSAGAAQPPPRGAMAQRRP